MNTARSTLRQGFPNVSLEVIDKIIRIVEQFSTEPRHEQLRIMIDILSHSSAAIAHQRAEDIFTEAIARLKLSNKEHKPTSLSERFGAHKRFKLLLNMFPDADQTYLIAQATKLDNAILLQEFVQNALEKRDYPKREDPKKYLGNQTLKSTSTFNFSQKSASTSSMGCTPPSKKRRRVEDSAEDMEGDDLFVSFVSTFLRNMPDGKNKRDLKKAIFNSLMNSDKEIETIVLT